MDQQTVAEKKMSNKSRIDDAEGPIFRHEHSFTSQLISPKQSLSNQATLRLLRSGFLQAKFTISQLDDIHEQETDRPPGKVIHISKQKMQRQTPETDETVPGPVGKVFRVSDREAYIRGGPPVFVTTGKKIPRATDVVILRYDKSKSYAEVQEHLPEGFTGPPQLFGWTATLNLVEKLDTSGYVSKGTLSEVSWGETSGLYPANYAEYDSAFWDASLTQLLQKARRGVDTVATRGESVQKGIPSPGDSIAQKLKIYHFIENFPSVDAEIADQGVKWFFMSKDPNQSGHPGLSQPHERVKSYGPFYNNSKGKLGGNGLYIHFFKLIDNQAVRHLLRSDVLQPKLTVSHPDDMYEKEADWVADQVMRMPEAQVQHQPVEEKEKIPQKSLADTISPLMQWQVPKKEEENPLQAKGGNEESPEVDTETESRINALQGKGAPLFDSVRSFMEPRFGVNFSDVRVHTDGDASETARAVNAQAFTIGRDIVFSAGHYAPETESGKKLLAHELTHVVQQRGQLKNSLSSVRLDSLTIQREAAHWYKPWVREYTFTPNGTIQYAIIEPRTLAPFDTGWTRDALGTGLLIAVGGLATTVLAQRLGLPQLLSLIVGGSSAFVRGYIGYLVQERVWGSTVQVHNWYGRYRINAITGNFEAVEFRGKGPSERTMVIPYFYQQRVADADGNVVYTHWRFDLTIPGVNPTDSQSIPENNYGTFD